MNRITAGQAHQIAYRLVAALREGQPGASETLPGVPEFVEEKGYLVGIPATEVPDLNLDYEHVVSVLGSWIAATVNGTDDAATAGVWTDDDGHHVFNLSTWHPGPTPTGALKVAVRRGETAIWDVKNGREIRPDLIAAPDPDEAQAATDPWDTDYRP